MRIRLSWFGYAAVAWLLVLLPFAAFAQEAVEAVTIHRAGWLDILTTVFALFGVGGTFAAVTPVKVRQAIPPLNFLLKYIGQNFLGAKNAIEK